MLIRFYGTTKKCQEMKGVPIAGREVNNEVKKERYNTLITSNNHQTNTDTPMLTMP